MGGNRNKRKKSYKGQPSKIKYDKRAASESVQKLADTVMCEKIPEIIIPEGRTDNHDKENDKNNEIEKNINAIPDMEEPIVITDIRQIPFWRRIKKGTKLAIVSGAMLVVLAIAAVAFMYNYNKPYSKCYIELGSSVSVADFLKHPNEKAYFTDKSETVDFKKIGDYELSIKNGLFTYQSILYIDDTTEPRAKTYDVEIDYGETCDIMDFIAEVEDESEVKIEYTGEPDFSKKGVQQIGIVLTDAADNRSFCDASLNIIYDVKPPEITGVKDILYNVGESISYKSGVKALDDVDGTVDIKVDSSTVDLSTPGEYVVTYSAIDMHGNKAEAGAKVTVIRTSHTEQEINMLAEAILSEIVTNDMTKQDKARAIFDWVKSHVAYTGTEAANIMDAKYDGLVKRRGDCVTFAAAAEALLDAAEIDNMLISRIRTGYGHTWNLVDTGEGWYHFDTTPRADSNDIIFMWTDEQLMEFSKRHYKSHEYDRTLYPKIN